MQFIYRYLGKGMINIRWMGLNSKNTSSLNIKILIVSGIRRTTTQLLLIIIFGYILVIYGNDHTNSLVGGFNHLEKY